MFPWFVGKSCTWSTFKLAELKLDWAVFLSFAAPHAIYFKVVPKKTYEKNGFRGDVIFPGGMILEESGEVKIYYGAADTVECLAIAEIGELLDLVTGETV